MDDTMRAAMRAAMRAVVVGAVEQEVSALFDALVEPAAFDLEQAEQVTRAGVLGCWR